MRAFLVTGFFVVFAIGAYQNVQANAKSDMLNCIDSFTVVDINAAKHCARQ